MRVLIASSVAALCLAVTAAGQEPASLQVTIEFTSPFPGNLQIRDEVCKRPRGVECERNLLRLNSEECRHSPQKPKCEEARLLAESSSCVEGLVFEGWVSQGENIRVWTCASGSGFANVSVRDVRKGAAWTLYPLLHHGDSVKYP